MKVEIYVCLSTQEYKLIFRAGTLSIKENADMKILPAF